MPHGKQLRHKLRHPGFSSGASGFLPGNRVTLLRSGEEFFPAIEAAFDRAKSEIHLETYIYENDAIGRRIADALKRAALRGVAVYLLIDGYGSKDLPRTMLDYLRADGVKILVFRPKISPWTFRRIRLRRMHRKIAVVDREMAFVGGINIIDDRTSTDGLPPRYDYAIAVEGPLVDVILLSARHLWSMVAWSRFHKGTDHHKDRPVASVAGGEMNATFLVRDNFRHRQDIEKAYLLAIERASSEIILANAYFLPGRDFRHALINAAGRGVRVVLLLQGRVDHVIQHYASRALYGNLLDAGIEIYEYSKTFLHAKVAVIDEHWATVGSSNIDPFSLLLAREANVVVINAEFGATLKQSLQQTIETDGRLIQRESWKHQSVGLRFISWFCFGLLRFLMAISGYVGKSNRTNSERPVEPEV